MAPTLGQTADLEFMPWTEVKDLAAARDIITRAGSPGAGVLIDALHFDRSGSTLADIATLDPRHIHYVQLCDGDRPFDPATAELIRIARSARRMPGFGEIDLVGLARAIPGGTTVSIEVPDFALARKLDARARAAIARS